MSNFGLLTIIPRRTCSKSVIQCSNPTATTTNGPTTTGAAATAASHSSATLRIAAAVDERQNEWHVYQSIEAIDAVYLVVDVLGLRGAR